MSIRRLCVRISKCSWESLSLKGDFTTAYTFFSVGSGTGPETVAPVRVAVSTISLAAVSMADESYALRRMRILFWAMATFCPVLGVKSVLADCAKGGRPRASGARPLKVVFDSARRGGLSSPAAVWPESLRPDDRGGAVGLPRLTSYSL